MELNILLIIFRRSSKPYPQSFKSRNELEAFWRQESCQLSSTNIQSQDQHSTQRSFQVNIVECMHNYRGAFRGYLVAKGIVYDSGQWNWLKHIAYGFLT